jgi:hypothetical protein
LVYCNAEFLQLGLCSFPLWHLSAGALIIEELVNVKSRRVVRRRLCTTCLSEPFLLWAALATA